MQYIGVKVSKSCSMHLNSCSKMWSLCICFNRRSTLILNNFLIKSKGTKYSIVGFSFHIPLASCKQVNYIP